MQRLSSPYTAGPPDYDRLARDVAAFAAFVRRTAAGAPTIDYKDQRAVKALTSALLERDFNLKIELPDDRLCPMVPGRLDYILFMLQLSIYFDPHPRALRALDVGTGASAIYALLALRCYPDMHCFASDIDARSLAFARRNVELNQLQNRITIVEATATAPLLPTSVMETGPFDFVVCNPPFYESEEEIELSAKGKQMDPYAVCTGASNEMITEGGEVNFVGRMIDESLRIAERIRWYSSLLGKFSSIDPLVALLKTHGIENYTLHALSLGQTTRHILIWSFAPDRIPYDLAGPFTTLITRFLPASNRATYHAPPGLDVYTLRQRLVDHLDTLNGVCITHSEVEGLRAEVRISAMRNSWSRSARRRKIQQQQEQTSNSSTDVVMGQDRFLEATFVVREKSGEREGIGCCLIGEWTRGRDETRVDWTKLWAYLIRKVGGVA